MKLRRGEEAELASEVPHFRIPEPVGNNGCWVLGTISFVDSRKTTGWALFCSGRAYEPVVPKTVGEIRTSYDSTVLVTVVVLLSVR